jgi:hypothetical protein
MLLIILNIAILANNNSALDLIDTYDASTPTGLQLFVKSSNDLLHTLEHLEHLSLEKRPHFKNIIAIDLNFGCPSKDIINEGKETVYLLSTYCILIEITLQGEMIYTLCTIKLYQCLKYILLGGGPALLKRKTKIGENYKTDGNFKSGDIF